MVNVGMHLLIKGEIYLCFVWIYLISIRIMQNVIFFMNVFYTVIMSVANQFKNNVMHSIQVYSLIIWYLIKMHICLSSQCLNRSPDTSNSIHFLLIRRKNFRRIVRVLGPEKVSPQTRLEPTTSVSMMNMLTLVLLEPYFSYFIFWKFWPWQIRYVCNVFIKS